MAALRTPRLVPGYEAAAAAFNAISARLVPWLACTNKRIF